MNRVGGFRKGMLRNQRGFSLPELLAAVALIGLLTTLGVYTLNSASWRSAASCRELVSRLELTRSQSVLRQNDVVVTFDPNEQRYTVLDDLNNDGVFTAGIGESQTTYDLTAAGADMVFGFADGVDGIDGNPITDPITFAADEVTFSPLGTAETGVIYMITAQGRDSGDPTYMRAISVSTATARIRRWKYDAGSTGPGPWKLEQ